MPTEQSVTGAYYRKSGFEHNSKLILNDDKTFKLEAQDGLMFFETTGTWALEGKDLILTSYPGTNVDSFVKEKRTTGRSGIHVNVVADEVGNLAGASIKVYNSGDSVEAVADWNGDVSIVSPKWDSLSVSFVGCNSLTLRNTGEDYFIVHMTQSAPIGISLSKERWRTKGNMIFDPRFNDEGRRNAYRRRTNKL